MDVPNSDGHTPVFAAVTHCRLECLRALADAGAELSRRDLAAGNTPAMVAASYGQTSCLRFLFDRAGRQSLADRNNDGLSSACFAVLCGRDETLAAIAEIDPSLLLDPDPKGWSAPHYAAAEGKIDCLRVIAEACATTAAKTEAASDRVAPMADWRDQLPRERKNPLSACLDEQRESPLHVAARAGQLQVFEYLVNEAGLRPEDANARGETCLWIAAAYDKVSSGSDPPSSTNVSSIPRTGASAKREVVQSFTPEFLGQKSR